MRPDRATHRGVPPRTSSAPADPHNWAATLSCYTAALAVWVAATRDRRWWRPLLTGTPLLAIRPEADGLVRFEHHSRPPARALGLTARYCDDWAGAQAAYRAELATHGALVICGDVYRLPWQRGYQGWHSPHWFTVLRDGSGWLIDDPLEMNTVAGPQRPTRLPVDAARLAEWALAPPQYPPVHRLRELAALGYPPPGIGARYRWLAVGAPPRARSRPATLAGPDAVHALADGFRRARPGVSIHAQADDFWQALRQRELLLAAAAVDPDLVPPDLREHWQAAITGWRRIPLLLMHARLRVESGLLALPGQVADAVAALAAFEGDQWRVPEDSAVPAGDER